VNGYVLDIRFRMLQPHELASAMSFPKTYQFQGTREHIIKQIGNAWPGEVAKALCNEVLADYVSTEAWKQEQTA
jgi:DNA (cytosine-5)-methyltransferase 1